MSSQELSTNEAMIVESVLAETEYLYSVITDKIAKGNYEVRTEIVRLGRLYQGYKHRMAPEQLEQVKEKARAILFVIDCMANEAVVSISYAKNE